MMQRWILFFFLAGACSAAVTEVEADLLIVGGNEAAVAAAVQAARLDVERIVLVNDIEWLGGQFSAEGVGAVDEWTLYRRRRVNFPRSGTFLEIMRKIRRHNGRKYGVKSPGNAFTAMDTIEPADAAGIFEEFISPYTERGSNQVRIFNWYRPVEVHVSENQVTGVTFENVKDPSGRLRVQARLTIDSSDWGDVIRLSGAEYSAGPDLKSRFGEENAPVGPLGPERNEMNPITYCVVVRETGRESIIPEPKNYDIRNYYGSTGVTKEEFSRLDWPPKVWSSNAPPFVNASYPEGMYSGFMGIYTHRRLIDRYHNDLPIGTEKVLLNWPTQDYPLYNFPQHVVDALEATEKGASGKNIVDMTYEQRDIVFEDAKQFSLGFLHFLQTKVHEETGDYPQSFRYMELTDEFGTSGRMPWKPYVREGLRLEALYMMREQDIRSRHNVQSESERKFEELGWARVMVPDNVFGFQFNIDFHPTRRIFLNDPSGPWMCSQTENRNWSTHTDRAGFPYRSLVPVELGGLMGASKNLGVSSIVSSAVRLHGQMMMAGQAAATAAALCLREGIEPREIARDWKLIREMQKTLVYAPDGAPGVLLWPYHDVPPDDLSFGPINMLAVRGIFIVNDPTPDFHPWKHMTRREVARALARAARSLAGARPYFTAITPAFSDVSEEDPDRVYIESLQKWDVISSAGQDFRPDDPANWQALYEWLKALGWKASEGLERWDRRLGNESPVLNRAEFARHLWAAIKDLPEHFPDARGYLLADHDSDGDGIPDLEDGLPFDRNNNSLPDRLDPGESKNFR